MRIEKIKRAILVTSIVIVVLIVIYGILSSNYSPDIGNSEKYVCDVKVLSLTTNIDVMKDGEKIANIKGDLIHFVTDPLTMYDTNGNIIAYAGDAFHLLAQDSHSIYVNVIPTVEMTGKVKLFGDKYELYDIEGNLIAHTNFNTPNTYGKIVGIDGKLWADYSSGFFKKDYTVRITDNSQLDQYTILMLMASFYSDRNADTSN